MELTVSVTGPPLPIAITLTEHGDDDDALEQVEVGADRVGDGGLDRVGVRHADDRAALVLGAQRVERRDDAVLHLGEALAGREPERRGRALHRAPLGQLHQLLQLGAGPLAEIALEEALVRPAPQAAGGGDRRRRLPGPLERRAVHGVDPLQLGDPFGGARGLLDALVGEVEAGRPAGQQRAGRRRLAVPDEEDVVP